MSSANSDPDLDAELLRGDHSRPGWRRRAVGVPSEQALTIPKVATMQTLVPIEPMRHVQAHIGARGDNQSAWLRTAIAAHYLAQGGEPAVAAALTAMERTERRRDVPRDVHGQDRNREGRRR
jgi:hypothetical protein